MGVHRRACDMMIRLIVSAFDINDDGIIEWHEFEAGIDLPILLVQLSEELGRTDRDHVSPIRVKGMGSAHARSISLSFSVTQFPCFLIMRAR